MKVEDLKVGDVIRNRNNEEGEIMSKYEWVNEEGEKKCSFLVDYKGIYAGWQRTYPNDIIAKV